jgi:hypothetical protein
LIKGECKEKDCVMWEEFEGDDGRLVKFCKLVKCIDSLNIWLMDDVNLLDDDFEEELIEEDEEIEDEGLSEPSEEEKKVEELNSKSAEDIYNDLFEYTRREFENPHAIGVYRITDLFWESKGISKYQLPPELKTKIKKAEILLELKLREERERERERQEKMAVEAEKEKIPEYIEICYNKAVEYGFDKVRLVDVNEFLAAEGIRVSSTTEKIVQSKVNTMLKSKLKI